MAIDRYTRGHAPAEMIRKWTHMWYPEAEIVYGVGASGKKSKFGQVKLAQTCQTSSTKEKGRNRDAAGWSPVLHGYHYHYYHCWGRNNR